jgi:ArsR family transcriptional regulator
METEVQKTCKRRAKVIKALAHVSRLYMVEMLSGHERCVDELTELVGSDLLPASIVNEKGMANRPRIEEEK